MNLVVLKVFPVTVGLLIAVLVITCIFSAMASLAKGLGEAYDGVVVWWIPCH